MQAQSILETSVYVDDLDAAERFYTAVMGLKVHVREEGRHVFFRCGQAMFLVFDPRTTATTSKDFPRLGPHGAVGPVHVAFRCEESELDAWREHLAGAGVEIENEVEWPNGGYSLYFRDPAGNSIELATPALWGLE